MAFAGPSKEDARALDLEGIVRDPAGTASGQAGQDVVSALKDLMGRHEAARLDAGVLA
jgi:hypothetical protein